MKNGGFYTVRVFGSAAEIKKEDWESIYPASAEGYAFFKTIDQAMGVQFKPHYVCIYKDEKIICLAPCFAMDYPLETTVEGLPKRILSGLTRVFPGLLKVRMLFCGCPAAEGKMGIKDTAALQAIEILDKELRSIAREEKAALITFKDFSEDYTKAFAPLLKKGFHKIQSYPSAEIEIRFGSFEEYLSSLSRPTRKGLKKKFRQAEERGKIELEVKTELGVSLDEAYELYLNNLNRSDVQFERITKEFFREISKNMPQETRYFLWRAEGKLIAFDLCLISDNVLIDEYIGLDYESAYKYHLYFVTFRDMFTWCIKNGVKRYETGALNYDPKKRLDFHFIAEYIYFRHNNPLLNFFFGFFCALLKPENFEPLLKEMKDRADEKK